MEEGDKEKREKEMRWRSRGRERESRITSREGVVGDVDDFEGVVHSERVTNRPNHPIVNITLLQPINHNSNPTIINL